MRNSLSFYLPIHVKRAGPESKGRIGSKMTILVLFTVLFLQTANSDTSYNFRRRVVPKVTTYNQTCSYKGQNFTDYVNNTGRKCEKLTCYAYSNEVVVESCPEPPQGCKIMKAHRKKAFPKCCTMKCVNLSRNCLLPNGTLLQEGNIVNSTDPCVRYGCVGGNLTTEKCWLDDDPSCSQSYPGTGPFPDCCGAAPVCPGSGGRRRSKREKK